MRVAVEEVAHERGVRGELLGRRGERRSSEGVDVAVLRRRLVHPADVVHAEDLHVTRVLGVDGRLVVQMLK